MITSEQKRPAALVIAEEVREERWEGYYDELRATWSNREYACASTKKHNESM